MNYRRSLFSSLTSVLFSSAALLAMSGSCRADTTYTYTDGETNSNAITITGNATMTLASGTATQSGAVTATIPVDYNLTRTGAGTLNFTNSVTVNFFDINGGTTILSGPAADGSLIQVLDVNESSGTGISPAFQITNSSPTINAVISVGESSTDEMQITNGAKVKDFALLLGSGSDQSTLVTLPTIAGTTSGNGTLLIDGSGSLLSFSAPSIIVGGEGTGTITLSNGGEITSTGSNRLLILGSTATGSGTVNIGAASGQAATGAGILNLNQVYTNGGSGEIVFNHTSNNYYFTQTGLLGGPNIWVHGGVSFLVENGTTTMTDINTNTGNTTITGGTLLLSKVDTVANPTYSTVGTGAVTVGANGTLGGNGRVNGLTTVSGILSPGNSAGAGLLNLAGGLTLNSGSTTRMELGGMGRGTNYDAINVTGTLNFGGTLQLVLADGFNVEAGDTFDLFSGSSTSSGTFSNITLNSPGFTGVFDPTTGDVTIEASVPEPSTFALVLVGGAMMGWYARRRMPSGIPRA